MKLFAVKLKTESQNKGRWYARQEFVAKFSDDINKARLYTEKDLKEFKKYCERAQQTFAFEEAWEVYEVCIQILE